jgi:hypothetical protein
MAGARAAVGASRSRRRSAYSSGKARLRAGRTAGPSAGSRGAKHAAQGCCMHDSPVRDACVTRAASVTSCVTSAARLMMLAKVIVTGSASRATCSTCGAAGMQARAEGRGRVPWGTRRPERPAHASGEPSTQASARVSGPASSMHSKQHAQRPACTASSMHSMQHAQHAACTASSMHSHVHPTPLVACRVVATVHPHRTAVRAARAVVDGPREALCGKG